MKSLLFLGIATLPFLGTSHGATYSTNFNGFGAAGSNIAGQDGWSVNDSTDQFSQVAQSNVNRQTPSSSSKVLNLGDASVVDNQPIGSSVVLSHDYTNQVKATVFSFNFVLLDSANGAFQNRDEFGISISTGGNDVFSIMFVPDAQSVDPDNTEAKWDTYYSVNGGATVPLNLAIFELTQLSFELSLSANAGNPLLTDFNLTLASNVNSLSDGATGLNLNPNTVVDELNVIWGKHDGAAFGSNQILIDNLSVVPEPSAALLGLVGAAAFFRRRRA